MRRAGGHPANGTNENYQVVCLAAALVHPVGTGLPCGWAGWVLGTEFATGCWRRP